MKMKTEANCLTEEIEERQSLSSSCGDEEASSLSSDYEDSSSHEEITENRGNDQTTMTVNQIANLLGTMKFSNVGSSSTGDPAPCGSHESSLGQLNTSGKEQSGKTEKSVLIQALLSMMKVNGFDHCDLIAHDEVPPGFFREITKENIKAYTIEVLTAVRTNDIKALKRFHSEGHCMQCCNKFGESILHLACRRGYTGIVQFLVEDASISVNIRDDYGRTPFHDACWVTSTDFDLIDLLLQKSPDLLFIKDNRGFSPLHYVKSGNYKEWSDFLIERKDMIVPRLVFSDRVDN